MDSEQNNWAGAVKTTFSVSRGILWQFFTEKRMVFHIFLHFEQNHCLLLPNIYGRVSETSIYVSGGKNWEKKSKKRLFLGNFVLWVKKNWTSRKTVWQVLSKMQSACPEESFEHFFLKKLWFSNEVRTLSEKIPDFA